MELLPEPYWVVRRGIKKIRVAYFIRLAYIYKKN